jgi:hypothetical protein
LEHLGSRGGFKRPDVTSGHSPGRSSPPRT